MLTRLLSDLRFTIGLFFGILGIILLITHFVGAADVVEGIPLDLAAGFIMLAFGIIMGSLAYRDFGKNS